jgi:hypothetical protein
LGMERERQTDRWTETETDTYTDNERERVSDNYLGMERERE